MRKITIVINTEIANWNCIATVVALQKLGMQILLDKGIFKPDRHICVTQLTIVKQTSFDVLKMEI